MAQQGIKHTFTMADGTAISLETGKLATQAHGSIELRCGNCVILATVVANKDPKDGQDFFPLSVDYQEKFGGAGRIPGSFHRREGKLSDYEILISRIVDRALRPLFPEDYFCDVQVAITLMSADKEILPDALAGLAAAAALAITDIPFNGPISEVRVAKVNGMYKINPTRSEIKNASIDIIIAATENNILMVEGEAQECSESEMAEAIKLGHEAIQLQINAIHKLVEMCGGKKTKRTYTTLPGDEEMQNRIIAFASDKVRQIAKSALSKTTRSDAFKAIRDDFYAQFTEEEIAIVDKKMCNRYFSDIEYEIVREVMINERIRLDGRKLDEVRPIWIETDYLPSAHGSAIFTRGETQSVTTATLGTKDDELMLDTALNIDFAKFILHYNFPGYSTGEVRPNRGPGRREVGHGNLAMRSLKQMLPDMNEYPYTIRVVSDILESNGSSSMATVCAGSLALFDAGVTMKAPISGIAMGLIMDREGKYAILSDILGDEDHLGDMDFKVTGTARGICACQMDIKIDGLKYEILLEALEQARVGRLHILNEMNKVINTPRAEFKSIVPRVETFMIDAEFIGAIIGPGGKNIRELQTRTNTTIVIEEISELKKGKVMIFSNDGDNMKAAVEHIKGVTAVAELGAEYEGIVKNIQSFGAFIEFLPGKEGLLHISEVMWKRLETMDGIINIGDKVKVKLLDIDSKTGKYKLSRKALLPKPEMKPKTETKPK